MSRNDLSYKVLFLNGLGEPRAKNRAPITLLIFNDNGTLTYMDILLDMLSIEKMYIAAIVFNVQTQQLRH